MTKPTKQKTEWEKSFEEEYLSDTYEKGIIYASGEDVKDFIRQLLSTQRQETLEWCLKEVGTLLVVDVEQEISFLDRPLLIELKKRHNEMVVKYNNKIADVCQIIKNKMEEGK